MFIPDGIYIFHTGLCVRFAAHSERIRILTMGLVYVFCSLLVCVRIGKIKTNAVIINTFCWIIK